jgi:hypothetical protein
MVETLHSEVFLFQAVVAWGERLAEVGTVDRVVDRLVPKTPAVRLGGPVWGLQAREITDLKTVAAWV